MSRAREDDLAYGELPQRWDRARFERFGRDGGGGGGRYEEDIRVVERDRPGRTEILIAERERSRPPAGGRYEERDRFYEDERYTSRPRRRTDRELFGDIDPRELVSGAMTTYRKPRDELDIERRRDFSRPGLLRRQSSLDTFDRRSTRYERDEYRVPPYVPVPLPIRRRDDDDYREVEIRRERSVHRREKSKKEETRSRRDSTSSSSSSSSSDRATTVISKTSRKSKAKSSKAPSVHEETRAPTVISKARSRAGSVRESIHLETEIRAPSVRETAIIEESVREERQFKKGKTRMPKRMVAVEAILDLGYAFDEEDNFFVLRVALEKEQIDEVIRVSEVYRNGGKFPFLALSKPLRFLAVF
jgi:hypothetical protein